MPLRFDLRHSTWATRLAECLRTVVSHASENGVGRKTIAFRMGRSQECIGTWLEPSQRVSIPGGALFEMLCREDLLPQEQRDELWQKMAREAGYIVIREDAADLDTAPPVEQLAEISVAVGKLSGSVLDAMRSKSAGGSTITSAEADLILVQASKVHQELAELMEAAKRAKKKGGRK